MRTKYVLLFEGTATPVIEYAKRLGLKPEDTFTDSREYYNPEKDLRSLSNSVWDRMEVHDLKTNKIDVYN